MENHSVTTLANILELTTNAIEHFEQLLQHEDAGTNIRIDIEKPMTQHAEVVLTFCPPNAQAVTDLAQPFANFILYLSESAQTAMQAAVVDFFDKELGGQLSIKAPNLKGKAPASDAPLAARVEYVLHTEVNPKLASHGGMISLVDLLEDGTLLLRFGGGCHGCGMAKMTLKQGVESVLTKHFPEIKKIVDVTEHATGVNPYFSG